MSLIPPKVGAVLTLGTMLHPVDADPGDALAAFTEYAADAHWVATHLTQYLGVALMFVGLVTVRDAIQHEPAGWIARLGVVFGVSALTVAAVLQAVDGIALKVMVDSWSSAPLDQKQNAFMAAFAVRQIEIGLASFMGVLFGVTVILCGLAIAWSKGFPAWLGWGGAIGGLGTVAGGLLSAHTGFSTIAMNVAMPFNLVIVIWMILVGVVLWRRN